MFAPAQEAVWPTPLAAPYTYRTALTRLIGVGQLGASYLWRRRRWERLLLDRLLTYEQIDGPPDLNAMIRRADFVAACHALRRAKLNPYGGTRVPDATDLDLKLIVARSADWHPPGSPEMFVQVRECLRAAGIRARVAGQDINAGTKT